MTVATKPPAETASVSATVSATVVATVNVSPSPRSTVEVGAIASASTQLFLANFYSALKSLKEMNVPEKVFLI